MHKACTDYVMDIQS